MTEKHQLTIYRESKGQTLEDFAARVDANKGMVWKWENGVIPRPRHMKKIMEATKNAVGPDAWYVN